MKTSRKEVYTMTANQIEYAKLLETRRNNEMTWNLTDRRDSNTAKLGFAQLEETRRSNVERERQGQISLDETNRANLAKENLTQQQVDETKRANLAKETETRRHNLSSLSEVKRSNVAKEQETQRHNLTSEAENLRHNVESESLSAQSVSATRYAADQRLAGNLAQTYLGYDRLAEEQRSNLARESETARSNLAKETETSRSNQAREFETRRSNLVSEAQRNTALKQEDKRIVFDGIRTGSQTVSNAADAFNKMVRSFSAIIAMGG